MPDHNTINYSVSMRPNTNDYIFVYRTWRGYFTLSIHLYASSHTNEHMRELRAQSNRQFGGLRISE